MYCVKCGVELADSERVCPLCETPVYFPGLDPDPETPYPKERKGKESSSRKAVCFLITCFFAIFAAITVLCDVNINDGLTWSGIAVGGLVILYVLMILPSWFKHPSPAIFVPCDFLAAALYLFYLNYYAGDNWYFSFALPVTAAACVICSTVAILAYYLRRGRLYIAAGAFIGTGLYSVLIEILIHSAFDVHHRMAWSLYPAITLSLIGIMLIVIAIVRPIREQLYKIFSF